MSSDTYLKIEYNFCCVGLFSGSFRSHVVTQGSRVFGTLLYVWQIKKPRKHLNCCVQGYHVTKKHWNDIAIGEGPITCHEENNDDDGCVP